MALVTKVLRSQLSLTSRIDAEHYSPRFTPILHRLSLLKNTRLKATLSQPVITGHTPSTKNPAYYSPSIVQFIKTDNLREDRIDTHNAQYISESGNSEISGSELRADDVLVTIIGATEDIIGRTARIHPDFGRANINQNIALIRSRIPAGYLTVFLNSCYGREQLIWLSRQTGQVNLNCREVEEITIPLFSNVFIQSIHKINTQRHQLISDSRKIYTQAETILLSELNLRTWRPSYRPCFIKTYKTTMEKGRIDSEYFQPKFDELKSKLTRFNPKQIKHYGELVLDTPTFEENRKYRYIEIGDVNTATGEVGFTERDTKELPPNAKILVHGGELIISKVRPTRGAIGIVPDECSKYSVCSSAFTVINTKSPYREFLQVYLRSPIGKILIEQPCRGTSYPTIDDVDVKNLLVPTIKKETMLNISKLIHQSNSARSAANALLSISIHAVELAIENSEKAASSYLKTKQHHSRL